MKFDVQGALAEILPENITPATSAILATNTPNVAEVARVAVKAVQTEDIMFDARAKPNDPEIYAEALRIHGPMSYGMAMRVLGWGGTRAGHAQDVLQRNGRVQLNNYGWAYLSDFLKYK